MKISVIMPAYNAEKYLNAAIESVLSQGFDSYELIVVDDGSKDGTAAILDRYAGQQEQVRVFHRENSGVSATRNFGMSVARGAYFYFLDSDDLLAPDALERMYQAAAGEDADLVIARYDIFNDSGTFYEMPMGTLFDQASISPFHPEILWTYSVCNKLFKAELLKKENISFPPISNGEDGVFTLRCVHLAHKITGIKEIVYHYRRLPWEGSGSITSSISVARIREFIEAHRMIDDILQDAMLKKYPQYASIEEVRTEIPEMDDYLNEFRRKEVQLMINQYYSRFWSLDDETLELLTGEMKRCLSVMNMDTLMKLVSENPGMNLLDLKTRYQDALADAFFTVALFGNAEDKSGFLSCLKSLNNQNFLGISILIPAGMESAVREARLWKGNLRTIEENEKEAFYQRALALCQTPYILFADGLFSYSRDAFICFYDCLRYDPADYVSEMIYTKAYGTKIPVYYHRLAYESISCENGNRKDLYFDRFLPNHVFQVSFLRDSLSGHNGSVSRCIPEIQKKGYLCFSDDQTVFFHGKTEQYLACMNDPEADKHAEENMSDVKIGCLQEDALERRELDVQLKFWPFANDDPVREQKVQETIRKFRDHALKNQVLFISFRKDKELEENLAAVYKAVRGKKVVIASRVPHSVSEELKIYKLLLTSKVIVTDDYLRYLRNIKLREEQKVIQLWHACGAMKQFGLRFTTLSKRADQAIHAQYNLVSVSSSDFRWIFADAFSVPIRNVQALGVPQTDIYFDQVRLERARKHVLSKYSEWKGKRIILYAPAFRNRPKGINGFHPPLDFEKLSCNLPEDCVFAIHPDPDIKNPVLEKEYPNIVVANKCSVQELMIASDLLVTDYSQIVFEYGLLKKPILFFCYDMDLYERNFFLQYPDDLPGALYKTQEELEAYFKAPEWACDTERHEHFRKKYLSACDGKSSERIAALIDQYLGVRRK